MSHVTADLAFQFQSLFLSSLRKFPLKRILLPAVTSFLPRMSPFPFGHSPTLSSLVKRNRMSLMLLAFGTESCHFFRNIHSCHYQSSNENTTVFLYFFTMRGRPSDNSQGIWSSNSVINIYYLVKLAVKLYQRLLEGVETGKLLRN